VQSTPQFSISLPNETADAVRAKVASGESATEGEVICEGLRAVMARDQAVESWLRKGVSSAYEARKASPSRAVSVAKGGARLAPAHMQAAEES